MEIKDDLIVFNNLVRPSDDIVGETRPVKAKVPKFSAPNAEGNLRAVKDFREVGTIAREAGEKFSSVFA